MPFSKGPLELYTRATEQKTSRQEWRKILASEYCPYLEKKCDKIRKSQPDLTIGTCTVGYMGKPVVICPHRFLQRRQVFIDTIHLLEKHAPGHQLHVVSEIEVPGGSIDYFVASVHQDKVKDYLAVEIQTLDSTGTVWPSRQQFIRDILRLPAEIAPSMEGKSYGMNWKMTAKTILVQMHHKVETLERLGKKLVLVIQDVFYDYMAQEFSISSLRDTATTDSVHFHVYSMRQGDNRAFSIELVSRSSTTTIGIEQMLGLRQSAAIPEEDLLARIQAKISDATLLKI